MSFKPGFVGILTEAKIFLSNVTTFGGKLVFEGSNDNFASQIVQLYDLSESMHDGWNIIYGVEKFDSFNSYRFTGNALETTIVTEMLLFGVETLDSDDS